ncbi:hypothetical protein Gobs01_04850 [Geodermatophilus obscurus DSM 43160]|uniref:Uncharacterized protein n=2 Tax=Geodermatophilus obscurus (strain ATCC 25078 / DSM 43160 / JCM 3152 / CCUG 61914 / KCC A-0152 / KCTC 9177 / NBRC 13315 / NRRL B-3577 / G-20) TaxID=526225 RepID=D2S5K0_GEOOG|nr:hypothetical protein Gobs_2645 [Geodermatophilus obscurus DSM 43160]
MEGLLARTSVTRREYDEWLNEAAALGRALRYPVRPEMVNDSAGIVFGEDQYDAFENGLWSREPYEAMVIFESLNEPAVDGLPAAGAPFAEYSGLCDKLMIVHPGKFCPPHYHQRKTESYEVVLGEMELFYSPKPVQVGEEEVLSFTGMHEGSPWPDGVALPIGREESYAALTSYRRLRVGDPKFVMHRKHLHAFRCPADSDVPLVVREVSTYSHEPTEEAADKAAPLPDWAGLHDNSFVAAAANSGRLRTAIQ